MQSASGDPKSLRKRIPHKTSADQEYLEVRRRAAHPHTAKNPKGGQPTFPTLRINYSCFFFTFISFIELL